MATPLVKITAVEPSTAEGPPEPQHPYPPRFWWTKRLLLALLVVGVLVTGTRMWWGHIANQRFNEMVADLRARGEPALAQDLNREPVPDATNAVTYLNQAARAVGPPHSPAASNVGFGSLSPPYPQLWMDMAAVSTEANAAVFPLLRQARQQPEIDWGLQFTTPVITIMLPMLNNQRHLANTAGDAALYLHFQGDDAEALRLIEDIFFQADAIDQQPILVSHLVATGIRALALDRLQTIATGLTIEGAPYPSNPDASTPATREQVQALIQYLLNEQTQVESLRRAMQGERVFFADSTLWSTQRTYVTRPLYLLEAAHGMRWYDRFVNAAGQPTLSSAVAIVPSDQEVEDVKTDPVRPLTAILLPSLNRVMMTSFRVRGEQRMIAVALAVRLYYNDHGRYPERLEELVPAYLPQVPEDPFADDARPLGYILAASGTRPIVYHVDEDGADNTPDESVLPTRPLFGWQDPGRIYGPQVRNNNPVDQWRDISAWKDRNPPLPPPPPPDEYLFDSDGPEE